MVKLLFFLFLFISVACQKDLKLKKIDLENTILQLNADWLFAKNIKKYSQENKLILQPPGAIILVMELKIPKENTGLMINQCVFYRVPFKEVKGEILIEEKSDDQSCSIQPSEKIKYVIDNVHNFKVNLEDQKLIWDFEIEKAKYRFAFNLINLETIRKHTDYEPFARKTYLSFLTFVNEVNEKNFRTLGKADDRYSLKTAINCLKVNDNCEIVGENKCDFCKFGHYEVIREKCQIGPRFCGTNHCGEKDEPACLRGKKSMLDELDGICNVNLEPFIDEQKILICH